MDSNSQIFQESWWDDFRNKTKNMSAPAVFNDCMPSTETLEMRQLILTILKDLANLRTNKYGYRVYLNDILLETNQMDVIYDSPPKPEETLEAWVERVFGNTKFGMIINQGERYNLDLSNRIALKLKPLLDKTGIPTEGIIFTLFLGNYDNTPLGIHTDLPGKSVLHFHLGPGSKTMYTWDTETYNQLAGEKRQNNKDLEKFLPIATEHHFNEGDLYFMPENIYHVGTQTGLSIGIACWFFNRSNNHFASRLLAVLLENFSQKSDIMLKPDANDLESTDGADKTLDLFSIPVELEKLPFKALLKEIYRDMRYAFHSNAGYRPFLFSKKGESDLSLTDIIEIEKPYKIFLRKSYDPTKVNLYVRGIKIELNNFDCLYPFILEINNGEPLLVSDLLGILSSEWPQEHGLYLLNLLSKHYGIRQVVSA